MDKKHVFAKMAVKLAIGAVVSAGIGYAIKGEKHLGFLVDNYFAQKLTETVTTES